VDYALVSDAKRLALFHHDPLREDEAVDRLQMACRQRAAASGSGLYIFAAAEGQELELGRRELSPSPVISATDTPTVDLRRSVAVC
jgi:hypothetical protein